MRLRNKTYGTIVKIEKEGFKDKILVEDPGDTDVKVGAEMPKSILRSSDWEEVLDFSFMKNKDDLIFPDNKSDGVRAMMLAREVVEKTKFKDFDFVVDRKENHAIIKPVSKERSLAGKEYTITCTMTEREVVDILFESVSNFKKYYEKLNV